MKFLTSVTCLLLALGARAAPTTRSISFSDSTTSLPPGEYDLRATNTDILKGFKAMLETATTTGFVVNTFTSESKEIDALESKLEGTGAAMLSDLTAVRVEASISESDSCELTVPSDRVSAWKVASTETVKVLRYDEENEHFVSSQLRSSSGALTFPCHPGSYLVFVSTSKQPVSTYGNKRIVLPNMDGNGEGEADTYVWAEIENPTSLDGATSITWESDQPNSIGVSMVSASSAAGSDASRAEVGRPLNVYRTVSVANPNANYTASINFHYTEELLEDAGSEMEHAEKLRWAYYDAPSQKWILTPGGHFVDTGNQITSQHLESVATDSNNNLPQLGLFVVNGVSSLTANMLLLSLSSMVALFLSRLM